MAAPFHIAARGEQTRASEELSPGFSSDRANKKVRQRGGAYIYIYRERDGGREVHIYIYIEREREGERERVSESE